MASEEEEVVVVMLIAEEDNGATSAAAIDNEGDAVRAAECALAEFEGGVGWPDCADSEGTGVDAAAAAAHDDDVVVVDVIGVALVCSWLSVNEFDSDVVDEPPTCASTAATSPSPPTMTLVSAT